jgi:hypothetical protein
MEYKVINPILQNTFIDIYDSVDKKDNKTAQELLDAVIAVCTLAKITPETQPNIWKDIKELKILVETTRKN